MQPTMHSINFNERPMLVFWETTVACQLACKHCRAEAQSTPAPGELTTAEGLSFIESLMEFGRPYPVLIMTGGDAFMRPDIFQLVQHARRLGIPVGLSPSVTPQLTDENLCKMAELGVKAVSISLDGAKAATHEGIRGVKDHFQQTVNALSRLSQAGFSVQVNTAIMRDNVEELPELVQIIKESGVKIWEVFFLIQVGRGQEIAELSPAEYESVSHFLFDVSMHDVVVRTVEGPFFRRIVATRGASEAPIDVAPEIIQKDYQLDSLYLRLTQDLRRRLGNPTVASLAQSKSTRDGKGIIFVSHDGNVYPAGFLPKVLGTIREQSLASIYRDHPLLLDIRAARFSGRCGVCEYRDSCGGSRARAYAANGDPLGEDPACGYIPKN